MEYTYILRIYSPTNNNCFINSDASLSSISQMFNFVFIYNFQILHGKNVINFYFKKM